jgi:hypothetical protein
MFLADSHAGYRTMTPPMSVELMSKPDVLLHKLRAWLLLFLQPVWVFLIFLEIYLLLSAFRGSPFRTSTYPYFNYMADAFLHGQFHFRFVPPFDLDLVFYQNHYYLYWPPFPAVLMIPWVFLFGVGASDIFFTTIIGALNVAMVAALIRAADRRKLFQLSPEKQAALVIFFGLGTVHTTLAPMGRVWYTAQEIGFLCVVTAYWAALSLRGWRAFALAGLGIGCAMATRNNLILTGIFPAWYLLHENRQTGWHKLMANALAGLTPFLSLAGLIAAYNYARFGSILEVGLKYLQWGPAFQADILQYGAFNLHYLPTNFYYQYLYYPFPIRADSFMGGSLFLLSPVFLAIFWAIWNHRRESAALILTATILVCAFPILLFNGTGWIQFGPRFSLDFTAPLLLLTGIGLQHWRLRVILSLTALSVLVYLAGALILQVSWIE